MNNASALVRALRGPVMLIALGFLFAMDHMDGAPFTRTWPVLIIVFGLMKFFEMAANRSRQDSASSGPFTGGMTS